MMKKGVITLIFLALLVLGSNPVSATIDQVHFPHNNDILQHSARIRLNLTSTGSTGCYITYATPTGEVNYNQSVNCNGRSLFDLPNADGAYNLTVHDSLGNSTGVNVTIDKPEGILITTIYLVVFLILLSMLFITIINLAKLATLNVTVMDVAKSMSLFFALLIMYQLTLEYSNVPFVLDWLILLQVVSGFIMVFLPIVGFLVTFFKKMTDSGNVVNPKELTGEIKFK